MSRFGINSPRGILFIGIEPSPNSCQDICPMASPHSSTGDRLELELDPGSGLAMAFRFIPACPEGFLMGSREGEQTEQPVHRVILTEGFWMGETLVTRAQFACWTETPAYQNWLEENQVKQYSSNREAHKNHFGHGSAEEYPAENLSWYEARGYCEWLNEMGLPGEEGRAGLPSEAQWEYACRAGSDTEYWNGDGEAALDEVGWYGENSENKTQPVRSEKKPPNQFGLHDMHGNLWEWCRDAWDSDAYAKRSRKACNPEVYSSEEDPHSIRVVRGGSWRVSASRCRSAVRLRSNAGFRFGNGGFRVGLFLGPKNNQTSNQT